MFSVTNREKEKGCYNIQLSPEGEVNSGGYIPRRLGIYPPLLMDPEGDSCFSIYQIRLIKNVVLRVTISSSETLGNNA